MYALYKFCILFISCLYSHNRERGSKESIKIVQILQILQNEKLLKSISLFTVTVMIMITFKNKKRKKEVTESWGIQYT